VKGGRKKRKMGNIVSKKKEKERKQGLMKQMQSKAGEKDDNANGPGPGPVPASVPGGPVGGVEATLGTASLCSEFQAYLAGLDRAALVEPEEVGRAGSLQFLLAVRLVRGSELAARPALIRDIGVQYFPQGGIGLVLDNTELWTRCQTQCRATPATALPLLELAHDAVLGELLGLHLQFLKDRPSPACSLTQAMACLL